MAWFFGFSNSLMIAKSSIRQKIKIKTMNTIPWIVDVLFGLVWCLKDTGASF